MERFRQRNRHERSRETEQAATPEPTRRSDSSPQAESAFPGPFEHESYHVPRRVDPTSEGTGLFLPPWADAELDPQRLDGRSPQPAPRSQKPEGGRAPREGLADFLMKRAAKPSELPRAPEAWPIRPKRAETPTLFRGPAAQATEVSAAEDPRVFLLHRMLSPAALDGPGTDVQTRPRRSYPVRWPGTSRETRIRPEYHGVGVLQAATHAHGRLHTRGLGLMFPPHTVHARESTSVVVGNNCELTQVDHVHIRQAMVAQDDALRSGRVKEIVARAGAGRDNADVVHELRRTLNDLVERPPEAGPTTISRKLRADCVPSIHRAETVQLGDDAMTRLDSRYVVERTIVPAGALLADSQELASRYVAIVADASDDPGALAEFLGDLVGAAENATDDNVLGYADGLPEQRATVLGLFGMVTVNHATSVMIGVGNRLHTELDLGSARSRTSAS